MLTYHTQEVANGFIVRFDDASNHALCRFADTFVFPSLSSMFLELPRIIKQRMPEDSPLAKPSKQKQESASSLVRSLSRDPSRET